MKTSISSTKVERLDIPDTLASSIPDTMDSAVKNIFSSSSSQLQEPSSSSAIPTQECVDTESISHENIYDVSNITKKVNFKLGKIKSVASFLTSHTKKLLVNALVMPYFHYCSPAWSSAAPFRLRKVDKKVVGASNFLGWKDNYSIYNVINKDMSLLIFKALNNLAPNYICSKINMARNSHSHNTRGAAKNSSPAFFSQ